MSQRYSVHFRDGEYLVTVPSRFNPHCYQLVSIAEKPTGIPQACLHFSTREEAQAECDRRNLTAKREAKPCKQS